MTGYRLPWRCTTVAIYAYQDQLWSGYANRRLFADSHQYKERKRSAGNVFVTENIISTLGIIQQPFDGRTIECFIEKLSIVV